MSAAATLPDAHALAAADSLLQFCRAPQQFLLEKALAGDPAGRFRMGHENFMVLGDPVSIHAVLNGSLDDFEKGPLRAIPGTTTHDGLATADGADWAAQHAMLAPMFARRRIRELEPFVAQSVTGLVAQWSKAQGEPVDVLAKTQRLAFDVVAKGLLGIADAALADELFETLIATDSADAVRVYYLARRLGKAQVGGDGFGRSAYAEAVDRLAHLTGVVADERLARTAQQDDFIGGAMATAAFAQFAPSRKRSFLCDLVATMLSAGYVTTGESMFWSLHFLARHPAAQQRAREEVLASTAAGRGEAPVDAPPFLAAAFDESLRLYPSLWFFGRTALRAVRVGDLEIDAGTQVICSPYVLHRLPALWPDAAQWRPERFLPGASAAIVPRSFIPFGTGVRACVGRGLAQMELCALVAMTLVRFDIELVSDSPISLAAAYSMQPRERPLFLFKSLP